MKKHEEIGLTYSEEMRLQDLAIMELRKAHDQDPPMDDQGNYIYPASPGSFNDDDLPF